MEIENIVKEKNITHMDAVLWLCKNEGIEPDMETLNGYELSGKALNKPEIVIKAQKINLYCAN